MLTLVVPEGPQYLDLHELLSSFDPRVLEVTADPADICPTAKVELYGSELWTRLTTMVFLSSASSSPISEYAIFSDPGVAKSRKISVIYNYTAFGIDQLWEIAKVILIEDLSIDPNAPALVFLGTVEIWVSSKEAAEEIRKILGASQAYPWQVVEKW